MSAPSRVRIQPTSPAIRKRSKLLLGNADRLDVAAAIGRSSSGVVHAQELADVLRISPPRVRTQLLAFTSAGLMRLLPRQGMTVDYERVDDPFWDLVVRLMDAWS
jgi:DNA-binding transcriptional ArsR family regulator